jgi:hypothetical protein
VNQADSNQQSSTSGTEQGCLCRETLQRLQECLGVSPTVKQHLANSRIEFLKAIRAVIDERIENLSSKGQRGTRVAVE